MLTTNIHSQKSQVVEYNIIQMLTQNLVEVGSVCGPGEFLLSSYMENIESIGFTPKILKFCFAKIMFFTDKKS
jgi:hypothetical protein